MTVPALLAAALGDRYRIERELGHGGMAAVYLARDLKHDREVALKVLRQDVAAVLGAERFLNEIRIAARLDHPHILTLIDSGEADGFLYYVLPFVRGESLRDRLKKEKQLGLDDALAITRQVAGALDYAHRQNVIHRDIKPDNILLQEGQAMLADFGIALAVKEAGGSRLTETGLSVGTPQYMSPEQAAGDRQLDARSDIYSLATVVYEMLAGEPPFTGASVQTVVAKLLSERPTPLVTLRPDLPSGVDAAIQRALAKVPADRFATAGQFTDALTTPAVGGPATRRSAQRVATIGLTVAILVLGAVWVTHRGSRSLDGASPAPLPERHLTQATFLAGVEEWPAWSPDGRYLVYTAESGGFKKLFIRRLEASTERQLTTGSADDIQPAWSPDGRHIAFVRASLPGGKLEPSDVLGWYGEGGDIWVIDAEGGGEARLVPRAFSPSWSPDGKRLAFDAALAGPRRIWVTDAGGVNPQQLTTDSSEAVVHTSPRWSPDGSRIVFRRIEKAKSDIMVVDVASKATSWVTDDNVIDVNPDWSRSGRFIVYSSARGGGLNLWRVRVTPDGRPTGPPQQLTNGAGDDLELAVAPAGNRLAFSVLGINSDIWRLPVDRATGRATGEPVAVDATTRVESRGAWSPDGRVIAFNSDRLGEMNLWLHSLADGSDRQLTTGPGGDYQPNWSPDGTVIAFFSAREGNNDIWTVRVADGALTRLTRAPGNHTNPFFSPDGRRIAFHSDRDGRIEPWLMNADGSDQRRLAATATGGHFMRWSPDGQAVILRADTPEGLRTVRVSVESGAIERLPDIQSGAHMSFSPDHSRIMDVRSHKVLWVHPLSGAAPYQIFQFLDPNIRIDYPVWSPDGHWVLFDRAATRGGDIWLLEGIE